MTQFYQIRALERKNTKVNNYGFFSMQTVIPKFNDFKQPGERYRSWEPDR